MVGVEGLPVVTEAAEDGSRRRHPRRRHPLYWRRRQRRGRGKRWRRRQETASRRRSERLRRRVGGRCRRHPGADHLEPASLRPVGRRPLRHHLYLLFQVPFYEGTRGSALSSPGFLQVASVIVVLVADHDRNLVRIRCSLGRRRKKRGRRVVPGPVSPRSQPPPAGIVLVVPVILVRGDGRRSGSLGGRRRSGRGRS